MVLLFSTGPLQVWGSTTGQLDDSAPGGWLTVDWSTGLSTVITKQASLCLVSGQLGRLPRERSEGTEGLFRPRPCSINVQSKSQHAPRFQGWRNKTPLLNRQKSNKTNLQKGVDTSGQRIGIISVCNPPPHSKTDQHLYFFSNDTKYSEHFHSIILPKLLLLHDIESYLVV